MLNVDMEDIDNRYRLDVTDPHAKIFALAMQGLYEVEIGGVEPAAAATDVVLADEGQEIVATVAQAVVNTAAQREALDGVIGAHLTCDWTVDRLGAVERNILRLGVYMMQQRVWSAEPDKFNFDVAAYVRNIAARCAAEYCGDKAHALVMGVLDAVAHTLKAAKAE